ncbi:MAG: hypothetical protein J5526_08050 [Bacteroidales bacterium]|nr:hypothetical protein [Bacteroidales bacterium]
MKNTGIIKEKLPVISGTTAEGKKWSKTTVALEIETDLGGKTLALETMKEENIAAIERMSVGDRVECTWYPSCHRKEDNGITRYFTSLVLSSVRKL